MIITVPLTLALTMPTGVTRELLQENPRRLSALFVNDSDTTMYLMLGDEPATANKGIRLNPSGSSYEIGWTNYWAGKVQGYCAGASKVLLVTEISYAVK